MSQLSRVPSIDGLLIRDRGFFHVILCGSRFRGTWAWLIKNRLTTTLKLVKLIFDVRHRRRRVTVQSIQALFDFVAWFPFQKQESYHRPILLFFHFCQINAHICSHMRSKQNYESNSTEILTVAVYENVLHDSTYISHAIVAPSGGEAKYLSDRPRRSTVECKCLQFSLFL